MIAKFYNFAPATDDGRRDQLPRELRALAHSEPRVLAGCEAIGYDLPDLDGYRLIRDTSRPGRANLCAYVRRDLPLSDVVWHDLEETWHKTNPGAEGQHWPRSWLEFDLDGDQWLIGHQPPKWTDNVLPSQREGIALVIDRMAPWTRDGWPDWPAEKKTAARERRRIALSDWNRRRDEPGPGPAEVARNINGSVHGTAIDAAVIRNFRIAEGVYVERVEGVDMRSDHPHALVLRAAA